MNRPRFSAPDGCATPCYPRVDAVGKLPPEDSLMSPKPKSKIKPKQKKETTTTTKQTKTSPRVLSLFNHKGGVSKTTTVFNLGWALAERGHRVLMVDADPQCNLTGMTLELSGGKDLEALYADDDISNLYDSLKPAFSGRPEALEPATPATTKHPSLFLLPGHIDLATYEPELSMAHRLVEAMPVLQNLPGALGHLLRITAAEHQLDFVIVDMSPSIGALNQNILMQSDYFIVPTSPDYFCAMAILSLQKILPSWRATAARLRLLQDQLTYRIPGDDPLFVGMISQRYRPRSKKPAQAFQKWIDEIVRRVNAELQPTLEKLGMAISVERFTNAVPHAPAPFELAQIADFNSLIAHSQEHAVPIFALTEDQLNAVGVVLEQKESSRKAFLETFQRLARDVESLCPPR